MSTKIGHFEIISELAKSASGIVYKANDPQTSQTVALKAIQLSAFGPQAGDLQKCLLAEAEASKVLSHSSIPPIYGAGEIDGQFYAAMEYIQGNSIATMLARKEGFSVWDLLDIGRQVCSGLDHAHSHNVFHYSLEPAKIMCGWDGGVRILGYGISSVGKFTLQIPGVPSILYCMSPEQIRGEEIDSRSNFFSLGAIFYEMVADQKPFDSEDSETLRQMIAENDPVPPIELNAKIHPALSELIMKTLAKDPGQRYQNGRELLDDLEKCKETKSQAVKAAPVASAVVIPDAIKAANQAKFIGAKVGTAKAAATSQTASSATPGAPANGAAAKAAPSPSVPAVPKPTAAPMSPAAAKPTSPGMAPAAPKASAVAKKPFSPTLSARAAAAAGIASAPSAASSRPVAPRQPSPSMSAAAAAPQVQEPQAPKIAVDPMMAGDAPGAGSNVSFSDMTELPPLKEVYIEPTRPAAEEPMVHESESMAFEESAEKPQVQAREMAEKAVKEIKNVPPRLIVYSIAGAAVLILAIAIGLVMHINSLNSEGDSSSAAAPQAAEPAPARPAKAAAQPAPAQPAPAAAPVEQEAPAAEPEPEPTRTVAAHSKNTRKKTAAAPAPAIVPGQLAIDSTPQGAQVQLDGRSDPTWVTPFTLSGVAAGQHSISVSKAGYAADSRTVNVTSGSKAFVVTHLNQLVATVAVSSSPAGANIYIDSKDTGKLTPAQIAVPNGGTHVVLVRKSGYIDETTTAQFTVGQTVSFTPTLRALGNVDDIRTSGKMKKLFGGKDAQGMGTVSIKTQPKGAQVAINQHMLDKGSPVEVMLDPGNYIVDITMTGFTSIHKVITVDKGGKAVIDEVMQRE
jgi:eukaryotic-like serine/threonine-protein kinase